MAEPAISRLAGAVSASTPAGPTPAGVTGGRCPVCDALAPHLPPNRRYPVTWHSDSTHDAAGARTGPFPFTADELLERDRLLKLTPAQLYEELCEWRAQLAAEVTA